jgi:hypothetical protein
VRWLIPGSLLRPPLIPTRNRMYQRPIFIHLFQLLLYPILVFLLLRHTLHILLFDLLLPLAPLGGHDVLQDLVSDEMLHLADVRRADILGPPEAELLPQGVVVGDKGEALAEEELVLGEGQLVDELAREREEVEAETLEEDVVARVGRVGTEELRGLVEGT